MHPLNQTTQKKVLCIQDISCIGRCSLTVVLPTLSSMGLTACPLPTSLLSSHFLGFLPVVHHNQTKFCNETLSAFKQQNISFSGVLTGYLGNASKAATAKQAIAQNSQAVVLVDPVLADHGRLYKNSTPKMCTAMKQLCECAHILTPNVTESAVLLNLPPCDNSFSQQEISTRLHQLSKKYTKANHIVITGVQLDNKSVNAVISKSKGEKLEISLIPYETLPNNYPGTGDLFASVLMGSMLYTNNIKQSVKTASHFISKAIKHTMHLGTEAKFGVCFEPFLHTLHSN